MQQEVKSAQPRIVLWRNALTLTGSSIAVIALLWLLTFALLAAFTPANPNRDVLGHLVAPGILIAGVAIVLLGILLKSWRLRRRFSGGIPVSWFPKINLNDPGQRRAAKVSIAATLMLIPVMGVSGYHGYHYTASTEFCAQACHSVMEPQATTYEDSVHARVSCTECHIGPGAKWFVKSKVSGTLEVLAMMSES